MIQIKRIFLVLMAVMIFTFTTLAMTAPPAHAIVGPVLRVVGGETVDQVFQGMAYKLGQSFNDESTLDKARGRWNMEGYEKAKAYENQMNEEEKARWDKFNNEVKNAKIEPIPGKRGWGKILLTGAAFLTGADIIYNAATAFQTGYSSGESVPVVNYANTGAPGVYASSSVGENSVFIEWSVSFRDGTSQAGTFILGLNINGQDATFNGVSTETTYNPLSVVISADTSQGPIEIGGNVYPGKELIPIDEPLPAVIPATKNDGAITRVPEPFRNMGVVPGTSNVPAVEPIPEINPDSWVEIEVPLEPTPRPAPEVEPITETEWDFITTPGPITDPDKPPGDGTDPDAPPGDGTNPDAPPGDNPFPDMEKPPVETPEYPEEVTDPENTPTGGLFSKLFEWLKALLDALFKILNAILAIPSLIINALKGLLLALFVPTDGFWDDNVNDIRKVVTDELDTDKLLDEVDNLGGVSGGQFKDVIVSLMGVDDLEVIDADSVNRVLDFIHKFVRGVVFPFLIFYNINQLYKLIRGTSLVEATRNLNRMKGE